MSRYQIAPRLLLAGILVVVLMFGGLVHALIPHTHPHNEVVTETLHAAFAHHTYDLMLASILTSSLLTVLLIAYTANLLVVSRIAEERSTLVPRLRRGVVAYRKFR